MGLASFAPTLPIPKHQELKCHNCGESYSLREVRVQRSLAQFFASRPVKPSSVTPRLCWVCEHLYYQAHQPEGLDQVWEAFRVKGVV